MDTAYDFLQPEFLSILFFQQKSLVIYPYVDLKHLKALEVFTEGYSIINIDATALHNVSTIISHEAYHSYSLRPTFYFIINADMGVVKDLLELPTIHCIINSPENVESLVKGEEFIFYNKKNKTFLNYNSEECDLSYETELLQGPQNEQSILLKLRDIHNTASKIHDKVNDNFDGKSLVPILESYDPFIWSKILLLTSRYYDIKLPELPKITHVEPKKKRRKQLADFFHEYQRILKQNRKIGQEFIQALHNYREKRVNPANLEIEQLFYPEKLYTYLRNNHWKQGIPQDFTDEWVSMKNTAHKLTDSDLLDLENLFEELGFSLNINVKPCKDKPTIRPKNKHEERNPNKGITIENTIPPIEMFPKFKKWILLKVEELEKRISKQ